MRKAFPVAVCVVLLLWLLTIFALPQFFQGPDRANEFGDMFGAVNALFSGLALAALIATLWLQNQELEKHSEIQEEHARILRQTANLHALSALLASYTQQIGLAPGSLSGQERVRVDAIRSELERLSSLTGS